jgi:hypothetical protein
VFCRGCAWAREVEEGSGREHFWVWMGRMDGYASACCKLLRAWATTSQGPSQLTTRAPDYLIGSLSRSTTPTTCHVRLSHRRQGCCSLRSQAEQPNPTSGLQPISRFLDLPPCGPINFPNRPSSPPVSTSATIDSWHRACQPICQHLRFQSCRVIDRAHEGWQTGRRRFSTSDREQEPAVRHLVVPPNTKSSESACPFCLVDRPNGTKG